MTVALRPATVADDNFLYELNKQTLGELVEATYGPWDDTVQREFHRKWFDPSRLLVVLVDGKPAGVIDAQLTGDVFYIGRIEVSPEYQNRGIGTTLMHQLIDQAAASGASAVELQMLKANRVRALYERLGFQIVEDEPLRFRMRLDL